MTSVITDLSDLDLSDVFGEDPLRPDSAFSDLFPDQSGGVGQSEFTIVCDSREKCPFEFKGIPAMERHKCDTIDASTVIKVQDGAMKQLVQRMNMPGVSWKYQAKTRF